MKIKLVDNTEFTATSATGKSNGGLSVQIPLVNQAAFVSLIEDFASTNVATIGVYDNDLLIGQYGNQQFLSAQFVASEDMEGVVTYYANIETKGQDSTMVRIANVESDVTTVQEALVEIYESIL